MSGPAATSIDVGGEQSAWFLQWLEDRGPRYLLRRVSALQRRYGWTPTKGRDRTLRLVELLVDHACPPTLAVPGRVVEGHARTIRELHDRGAELAVHAHDHLDFRSLRPAAQRHQLELAIDAFDAHSIPVAGFRCPYLGYRPEMREIVPDRLRYSSNAAVWGRAGGVMPPIAAVEDNDDPTFAALYRFYEPEREVPGAAGAAVLPEWREGLLELPVTLPDDLQLLDGLRTGPDGVAEVWGHLLDDAVRAGGMYIALLHPETADDYPEVLEGLLDRAADPRRRVWRARLADIASWWEERSRFRVDVHGDQLLICCTPRATVLARGLDAGGQSARCAWRRVERRQLTVIPDALPFVGLPTPHFEIERVLTEEGFVVRTGQCAHRCATVLADVTGLRCERDEIVAHVEAIGAPLVRFARWPEGVDGVLSITGDLDALCLKDYARRLGLLSFTRRDSSNRPRQASTSGRGPNPARTSALPGGQGM